MYLAPSWNMFVSEESIELLLVALHCSDDGGEKFRYKGTTFSFIQTVNPTSNERILLDRSLDY